MQFTPLLFHSIALSVAIGSFLGKFSYTLFKFVDFKLFDVVDFLLNSLTNFFTFALVLIHDLLDVPGLLGKVVLLFFFKFSYCCKVLNLTSLIIL